MRTHYPWLLAGTLAAGSVMAQSVATAAWKAAHPLMAVSVVATNHNGVYRVSATITDARTTKVLATPAMLVKSGTPAQYEIGANPGISLRFTVTVDASGQAAQYRSETLRDGRVESGYIGTLHVQSGA